ncbi:MAG: hypothetical protein JWL69_2618 [Phycisphaerales bacterium]|nr:hypothetical protein [Phycisphaerales bacterium]
MGSGSEASVTRYHADGSLDSSFANGGTAIADFLTGGSGGAGFSAIALQSDGKIVVVGTSHHSGFHQSDMVAVRFNVDGSEDSTFGPDHGQITLSFGTSTLSNDDSANALAIQGDGKILVGGETTNDLSGNSLTRTFTIVRLNADGTPDDSFGDSGHVMTLFHDAETTGWLHADVATVNSLLVQGDGKIVAVGIGDWGQLAAARYNADGSLDSTFAYSGTFLTSALYSGNYTVHAMPDGGFAVAGAEKDIGLTQTVYYGRFDPTGKIVDSATFDGPVAPNPVFYNVAFAPDGGLVAAGAAYASPPSATDPNWFFTGDVLIAKFDVVDGSVNSRGTVAGGGTEVGGGSETGGVLGTGGTTTGGGSDSGGITTGGGSDSVALTAGAAVTRGDGFVGPMLSVGGKLLESYPIAVQASTPHVVHLSASSKARAGKLYRFTVTYTAPDNQPLTTSDQADVSVAGPADWQRIAKVVKSRTSHHGKRRAVTYAVQLPAGTPAAGLYTINSGAGKIGVFKVAVRS